MTNRIALALALALAACASTEPDPVAACDEIAYRLCDATKECGGDVDVCIAREHQVCPGATAAITADKLDACLDALEPHTCSGAAPVFSDDGRACLARFGL